ncbi:ornithine cyclodeaminase [Agrobacterium sp. CNPSo 2736]|uniref:ornithine cyclodeaminase n=1 Tax=Agrobacterium sp. CNPSo 2736 TaxID=2499627 RepID=UPI000FD9C531|nr:ornithine cyclodeaminase [Agrobacterium sp. CNPSo 2736]RVT74260.1 ornithine cyclodeaminase [Agrobacterium sp. CNPSo 2736]
MSGGIISPSLSDIPCYSAAEIARDRALLDGKIVHAVAGKAWDDIARGSAYGTKSVLSITPEEIDRHPLIKDAGLLEERLGWKLSCLSSVNCRYGAVKIVGANALNRQLGLPRSRSTIVLMDKFTLLPLCLLDGTDISAARTASYATLVLERLLAPRRDVSVFLFGAGPIAEKIILALDRCHGERVREVLIRSRTVDSAIRLARSLGETVTFDIMPARDNRDLGRCDFVITASNAKAPVFEASEIGDATVLHLGGDETPPAHLERALRCGRVLCDDVAMVSRRGSQSLALHFSRKGTTLEQLGSVLGIRPITAIMDPSEIGQEKPVHITCVGLPMLDLYVAAHVYETLSGITNDSAGEATVAEATH